MNTLQKTMIQNGNALTTENAIHGRTYISNQPYAGVGLPQTRRRTSSVEPFPVCRVSNSGPRVHMTWKFLPTAATSAPTAKYLARHG